MRQKVTTIELARIVAERWGVGRRLTAEQNAYLAAHYEVVPTRAEDHKLVVIPPSKLPPQLVERRKAEERLKVLEQQRRRELPPFVVDGPLTIQ